MSRKVLVYSCHVVAEAFQFHRHAHEIHLVDGGDVGLEGFGRTGLQMLVVEQVVGARGTFADYLCRQGVLLFGQQQHVLSDVVIHVVEVALVAQVFV